MSVEYQRSLDETHKLEEDMAERMLRLRLGLQTGLQCCHKLPVYTQDLLNVGEQDLRTKSVNSRSNV